MIKDLAKDIPNASRRELVETALARIADPAGQGRTVFTRVYADAARAAADAADRMIELGVEVPALAGLPISIKDLFDVKGETTMAGSVVMAHAPPATADAVIVQRLRGAGGAVIGKTNMTEFAFSGLGINPHYGTPSNVWKREENRIPGGSSSGAGISVTDGMAVAAIGTDTGGSVRIPAALNGLVGFKPSAQSVPLTGTLPLSTSFDSIGPIAATVKMCARVYSVLADDRHGKLVPVDLRRVVVGAVQNYVLDHMDTTVAAAYEKALQRLAAAGVTIREVSLPVIDRLPEIFTEGGIVGVEAYHWHRPLMAQHHDQYDPRVSVRVARGKVPTASDYLDFVSKRKTLIAQWVGESAAYDAMLLPAVPTVAPRVVDVAADDAAYGAANMLMLRNPTVINALDGCAISLPCHAYGEAPVGLMLAARNGQDWPLLSLAAAMEPILQPAVRT